MSLALELLKAMEVTPCTGSEPGSVTSNAVPQSFGRVAKKRLPHSDKWKTLGAKEEPEDATPVVSLEDH